MFYKDFFMLVVFLFRLKLSLFTSALKECVLQTLKSETLIILNQTAFHWGEFKVAYMVDIKLFFLYFLFLFLFFYFFPTFNYLEVLSMLSMLPLYIYFLFFDISFFLRDHNGNKAVQLFCAIPVTIDFLIVFRNSLTIM